MMSYLSRPAILAWLSIYWCAAMLLRATGLVLGMCVLGAWLLLDALPKRGQSQSISPPARRLPIPVRDGGDIFAIMPDGERVAVTPLAASSHAKAWLEVCAGAMVHEKTKLPD
jgi:hypothetical protein